MVEMVEIAIDELVVLDDNLEIEVVVEIEVAQQYDILVLFECERQMCQNDCEVANEFQTLVDERLEQIEQIEQIEF